MFVADVWQWRVMTWEGRGVHGVASSCLARMMARIMMTTVMVVVVVVVAANSRRATTQDKDGGGCRQVLRGRSLVRT